MPTYTLELTEDQQLALDYETERANSIPVPVAPGAAAPPRLSREAVLTQYVHDWLARTTPHVQATLTPLMEMIEHAPAAMRSALIAGVHQEYVRSYLLRKYGGMA